MNFQGKPNLKKLFLETTTSFMLEMCGPGLGSIAQGIMQGKLQQAAKLAKEHIELRINAILADPKNPFGKTDEDVAAAVMATVEKRRKEKMSADAAAKATVAEALHGNR